MMDKLDSKQKLWEGVAPLAVLKPLIIRLAKGFLAAGGIVGGGFSYFFLLTSSLMRAPYGGCRKIPILSSGTGEKKIPPPDPTTWEISSGRHEKKHDF